MHQQYHQSYKLCKLCTRQLDPKSLCDTRKFWNTVKPLSGTAKSSASVNLLENKAIISNDKCVAEIFNECFATVTNSLGIVEAGKNTVSTHGINDPVEIAITKYLHTQASRRWEKTFVLVKGLDFGPAPQRR